MLTLQNYVIFTVCQYNILCHFNISLFAVYLPPLGNRDHICLQFNVLCYSEYNISDSVWYIIIAANKQIML